MAPAASATAAAAANAAAATDVEALEEPLLLADSKATAQGCFGPSGTDGRKGRKWEQRRTLSVERSPAVEGASDAAYAELGYEGGLQFVRDTVEECAVDTGQPSASKGIVAAFVVAFDPHVGNVVEWCESIWDDVERAQEGNEPTFSAQGLEFHALPAGIHVMEEDCFFFRHQALYGVAAFHRRLLPLEIGSGERFVRMRSVGALASTLAPLVACLQGLRLRAPYFNEGHKAPSYGMLRQLLEHGKANLHPYPTDHVPPLRALAGTPSSSVFSEFIEELGPKVITIWKAMLLRKRILFLAPPAVSFSCDLVVSACALLRGGPPERLLPKGGKGGAASSLKPLLCVGLLDTELLEQTPFYVACTTEAILKVDKAHLYDVLVEEREEGWQLHISQAELADSLRQTPSDLEHFQELCGRPSQSPHQQQLQQRGASGNTTVDLLKSLTWLSCCLPTRPQRLEVFEVEAEALSHVIAMNTRLGQGLAEARTSLQDALVAGSSAVISNGAHDRSVGELDGLAVLGMGHADKPFLRSLLAQQLTLT
eukprot:SM000020S05963  [mRNA]  locus=s20:108222:111315:+ [translate_table: standard]